MGHKLDAIYCLFLIAYSILFKVLIWVASSTPIKSGSIGRAIPLTESMNGYLYILKNETSGRYYIGSTNNLERRLKQHKAGSTRTTRVLKTDVLVYIENYDNILEARLREKKLKSYKSKKYIECLISNKGR